MTARKCSYCHAYYDDDKSFHNYDQCVKDCTARVNDLNKALTDANWALEKAKEVQKQTWWRRWSNK